MTTGMAAMHPVKKVTKNNKDKTAIQFVLKLYFIFSPFG
jgi:hypothetical protein